MDTGQNLTQANSRSRTSAAAWLAVYNAVVNVFWSLLAFVPVSIFWCRVTGRIWLWVFVAVSVTPFFLPTSTLRYFALGANVTPYRQLGVPWVNKFVQHGRLINDLPRRKYPEYRRTISRAKVPILVQNSYVQERFHWTVLLFFLLTSAYAIVHGNFGWAVLTTVINVVYNLYPIWLQQYIRLRVDRQHSRQ
jgi:hypothetical protein